jgi:REP element-mobilizing transposase RayT
MPFNPQLHHRRSIRLQGYNYSQAGAYFVTLVAHERSDFFGEVVEDVMRLNHAGKIAGAEWQRLATRFPNLRLDAYIIMPNHLHGILIITEQPLEARPITPGASGDIAFPATRNFDIAKGSSKLAPQGPAPASIGAMIGQFKSRVTKRLKLPIPIWQRNYYEHIIRDQAELDRIRQYILDNPRRWKTDNP